MRRLPAASNDDAMPALGRPALDKRRGTQLRCGVQLNTVKGRRFSAMRSDAIGTNAT
jgi:hypothetical protein